MIDLFYFILFYFILIFFLCIQQLPVDLFYFDIVLYIQQLLVHIRSEKYSEMAFPPPPSSFTIYMKWYEFIDTYILFYFDILYLESDDKFL